MELPVIFDVHAPTPCPTLHAGAQLLLTIRLQDTCGNDAYLEVNSCPGSRAPLCATPPWGGAA